MIERRKKLSFSDFFPRLFANKSDKKAISHESFERHSIIRSSSLAFGEWARILQPMILYLVLTVALLILLTAGPEEMRGPLVLIFAGNILICAGYFWKFAAQGLCWHIDIGDTGVTVFSCFAKRFYPWWGLMAISEEPEDYWSAKVGGYKISTYQGRDFRIPKSLEAKQKIVTLLSKYSFNAVKLGKNSLQASKIVSEATEKMLYGEYFQALSLFDQALTQNEFSETAFHNRGLTKMELRAWSDAIADFTKVIELNGEHGLAHMSRGECYENLKRFREARADYVRSSVLDGDAPWLSERIDYCEKQIKRLDDNEVE